MAAVQAARVTKTLEHRTMAVAAAEELRRRILQGDFPEGFQLRQDALATEFGVSRIPIREALLQLESEGLVKILPHRGAMVSELSIDEIEELFDLRSVLEPRLLRRSAPRLSPADYDALDAILAEYGAEMRSDNTSRWGELNSTLHSLLYSHAERPRTSAYVQALLQNTDRYTRMQLSFTQGRERAETEHGELVELCRKGRIEDACTLLADHIRNAGAALIAFIEARKPPRG